MKITKLYVQGHSKGIIIPPSILKALKWRTGDYLVLEIFEKDVVLSKLEFPPHLIKRLSERKRRVYDDIQGQIKGREKTPVLGS